MIADLLRDVVLIAERYARFLYVATCLVDKYYSNTRGGIATACGARAVHIPMSLKIRDDRR